MNHRLQEFLQDLRTMPGVTGAFLCCRDGVIASTVADYERQKRLGRVYLNVVSGAYSLGHFIREIYGSFNNAVLMVRPVSRGCALVAMCKPGITTRLVDISLTMTVKSIEEELNGLEELPPPIDGRRAEVGPTANNPATASDDAFAYAVGDPEVKEAVETQSEV